METKKKKNESVMEMEKKTASDQYLEWKKNCGKIFASLVLGID